MSNGKLTIKSLGDTFIIQGDFEKISRNRFAMMYLRHNLNFEYTKDGIVIKDIADINIVMNHVKVLAKYAKCDLNYDEQVSDSLREYEIQENLFQEFSQQAKEIRDNHPNINELEEFKESLISNMPNRRLYFLQLLSAYHLAFAQNACNFSVPGAGKTSIVYGAYCYLKNLPVDNPKHVDRLLIIGPLSSFGPWENEFEECFGYKADSVRLISGMSKEKKSEYLHGLILGELTITSYQSVISLKDDLKFFLSRNKVMVVLDEAHKIKNTQGAITATSTLELAQYAKSRVVLTGTPAPNGYEDLYNMFKFIWPNRNIISYNVGQLENMSATFDDERVPSLINQIAPFFIRVRKSDLNIPDARFNEIEVPMSENQRSIYDAIETKVMQSLDGTTDSPFLRKIRKAKLIRLMQTATNPALLNTSLHDLYDESGELLNESEEDANFIEGLRKFVSNEIPPKFVKAAEIAEDIVQKGGKVVIWATFIHNIDILCQYLESKNLHVRKLYGATPVESSDPNEEKTIETRESIVQEFNRDDSSFNIIIANPFAVAESISLHKKCHNAIYLERTFNAAHFIQSKDRIHRYGLPSGTVTNYYYLISKDSIDVTINDRLKIKEARLNEIMESMPIPLFDNALEDGGLEDVKAILRDYAQRAKKV